MELFHSIMTIIVSVLLIIQTMRLIYICADRDKWRREAEWLVGILKQHGFCYGHKYCPYVDECNKGDIQMWRTCKCCWLNAAADAVKEARDVHLD